MQEYEYLKYVKQLKDQAWVDSISPRVRTRHDEFQTAFGFPTLFFQTQQTKHKQFVKSGVDGLSKHTRYVENEQLLNRDSHIQQAIRSTLIEEKIHEMRIDPGAQARREQLELKAFEERLQEARAAENHGRQPQIIYFDIVKTEIAAQIKESTREASLQSTEVDKFQEYRDFMYPKSNVV